MSSEPTEQNLPLRDLIHLWFGFQARVGRRAYAATGFALLPVKYGLDACVVYLVTGIWWRPLDYLNPATATATGFRDEALFWLLMLVAVPFVWIGASMTVRRALDAGLSGWTGLLFFVPMLNYVTLLGLCVLPSRRDDDATTPSPVLHVHPDRRAELVAAATAALLGTVLVVFGVLALGSYGMALFVGTPFFVGFVGAFLYHRGPRRHEPTRQLPGQLGILLIAGLLLLGALEGFFCLAMAWPLAAAVALIGSTLGHAVAARHDVGPSEALPLLLVLPLLMGAESAGGDPPIREVVSSVEIDAPPAVVWPHVVGFAELPPPRRAVFRIGIAHPLRARIEGRGIGAVRYCEFSTGAFVEPITVWDEPRRLSFDVSAQPEPMRELSPYARVYAPHLVDGLRSHRGEFRLVALPGGRTRLEGSTWYSIHMAPQPYWTLWSDALLHTIHHRVLEHVKALAEAEAQASPARASTAVDFAQR